MTLIVGRIAALGFIVSLLAMTSGCSSRSTPPQTPVPPQPDRPSQVPSPAAPTPEAPAPPVPPVDTESIDCALIAESGEPITTVALTDRVTAANAPHPSNEGERLLFRQLYETLVRADCNGQVRPGLAASWQLDANGRTWVITLRENARFTDSTPVTAADVQRSWTRDGSNGELRPNVSRLVESIVPLSERAAAITLRNQRTDAPLTLAHPDLAVAKPVADSAWPLGTRSASISPAPHGPGAVAVLTLTRDSLPAIRFLAAPGDPRDVLDKGVDLLLTRDPSALNYAGTLPQFQSVPLAWQRTLVLMAPGRSPSSPSFSENQRQALADDAVRGEARGAHGPFWWQTLADCTLPPPAARGPSPLTPRIVYDANDSAARDVAERLVGLDQTKRTYQRATGMTGEALARALRFGRDAGYVISVESRPVTACADLQSLTDRAPWLDPATIVPLVETRLQAIVRRGRSGVIAEWDGGLRIAGRSDPK